MNTYLNSFKRRLALAFSLALLAGTIAVPANADGHPADRDKCEKAERDRQLAEIDHAVGRTSEKELKDAKEFAEKACRPK